jgi:hypothetical protein
MIFNSISLVAFSPSVNWGWGRRRKEGQREGGKEEKEERRGGDDLQLKLS